MNNQDFGVSCVNVKNKSVKRSRRLIKYCIVSKLLSNNKIYWNYVIIVTSSEVLASQHEAASCVRDMASSQRPSQQVGSLLCRLAYINHILFLTVTTDSRNLISEVNSPTSWFPSPCGQSSSFARTGHLEDALQAFLHLFTRDHALGHLRLCHWPCSNRWRSAAVKISVIIYIFL